MKTLAIIFTGMMLFSINALGQSTEVRKLLKDPEKKAEIFSTIMNDHQLMMDFMNAMDKNQHATMMISQHMQNKDTMMMDHEGHMMHQEGMSGQNQQMHSGQQSNEMEMHSGKMDHESKTMHSGDKGNMKNSEDKKKK